MEGGHTGFRKKLRTQKLGADAAAALPASWCFLFQIRDERICLGMEGRIIPKADMGIPGIHALGAIGAKGLKAGVRPGDLR
jgi:hypothetical protein